MSLNAVACGAEVIGRPGSVAATLRRAGGAGPANRRSEHLALDE
jgi:hypothetical protein